MINSAVMGGHQPTNQDEYQPVRNKIKQYRKELGLI
jgi:hypothetical protein